MFLGFILVQVIFLGSALSWGGGGGVGFYVPIHNSLSLEIQSTPPPGDSTLGCDSLYAEDNTWYSDPLEQSAPQQRWNLRGGGCIFHDLSIKRLGWWGQCCKKYF